MSVAAASPIPRRKSRGLWRWWPVGIIVLVVLVAVLAPWLAPYDPNQQNLLGRLKPPGTVSRSFHYWLGSDELGRDLLSRVIHGARISLMVAFASVVLSGVVGTTLGMIAGYRRGWVEIAVMRVVDVFLSIPAILLAIITVAVLGPGIVNVIMVLALTRWPRYARIAYSQTLSVANMPYVRLSALMGASAPRVLFRHVLPNIVGAVSVVATLEFGLMILFEAGLSFLGLGVQPPTASWGAMLSTGRNYVATAWWVATLPGICLFVLVLAVNLTGDAVRDRLDPRHR
ncbi:MULTISPECIES: nickel transporter permease [Bosea]|uniref:nickel transporter permease n=1 Tax=Bosea TaxID=85413 RepID=UPI0021502E73|nr:MULTISPECIES: nickel transporter permease [Bosea]MCR4523530.1 ABC transporter permease [Bosea sp. 47.2.35]MDR6830432.1 peptide/nickel transport system permease protein [Bosea robiniae]MDR6897187.1 peptide/nickel transport system permease protein [Bosea sp. BE109]MDR7140625.1 peptide/nickel transport system permease protein [Bosea sp. BE168]MDR7177322.1 peptide/nickel transport system permease protein [Bosea sp. BE271]